MQNQTGFNLDESMTRWRETMASQPGLSAEKVRELESHLLDSIADLQRHGLKEEEAFWLACRRFGTAQDVAKEIVKADPVRIWTERAFWMVLGLLIMNCFVVAVCFSLATLLPRSTGRWSGGAFLGSAYLLMAAVAIVWTNGWYPKTLRTLIGRGNKSDHFVLFMIGVSGVPVFFWGLRLWQTLFPLDGSLAGPLRMQIDLSPTLFNLGLPVLLCGLAIYLRRRLLDGKYKTV